MGEKRNAHTLLVGKPERKTSLGRPRRRWEGMDWINVAQNRNNCQAVVNTVMKLRVS
jgi:hypothetical protein